MSWPVPAHFTHDIVSNTMLSYLYDELIKEFNTLQSHYEEHIQEFNTQETYKINTWLLKEQIELNTLPLELDEIRQSLNTGIQKYNDMREQWDDKKTHKARLKAHFNVETKKAFEENTRQINQLMDQINNLVETVNNSAKQLMDLETTEQKRRLFYLNQDYMSEEPLKKQQDEMEQWRKQQNQNLSTKIEIYNQSATEFEDTQEVINVQITKQKQQITQQKQALEQQEREINERVAEYNRTREEECKNEECIKKLEEEKAQIAQKKQEYSSALGSFNALVLDFNQYRKDHRQQKNEDMTLLHHQREELDQLKQSISAEWDQKQQQWEESWQKHQAIARRAWEQEKQKLSQFQLQLKEDYGKDFRMFASQFALWSQTLQDPQQEQKMAESSSRTAIEEALCTYSQNNLSALLVQNLCDNITQLQNLQEEAEILLTKGASTETQIALNKIKEEIEQLGTQIEHQFKKNEEQTVQLNHKETQYNAQRSRKKQQNEELREELAQKRDTAMQFISIAYKLRASLLNKEHELLALMLTTPFSSSKEQENITNFKKSWADFMSVMSGPLKDVRGFPENWTKPFRLVDLILVQVQRSIWPISPYTLETENITMPTAHFSNEEGNLIQQIEKEEKREVLLTWMNTPFISDFLNAFSEKTLRLLTENKAQAGDSSSQDDSITPFFDESVDVQSPFLTRFLFLESMYHLSHVQKIRKNQQAHYQLVFNDLVLWFQIDGKLERPIGIY